MTKIKRFVILCQPRTGSCLLQESLGAHPQITMHGEVINTVCYPLDYLPANGAQRLREIFRQCRPNTRAVGCRLHACQPDESKTEELSLVSAWDELYSDQSARVICLRRIDQLAQLLSFKIAETTGRWVNQNDLTERPKIKLSKGELRWFQEWNRICYNRRLERLAKHHLLEVTYENLCANWHETISKVLEFLEMDPMLLSQTFKKQEIRGVKEIAVWLD